MSSVQGARRVLVVRLDNCGDVLLTGPAVRAVAAGVGGGGGVVLLCGPRGRAAAELLPGVDQVVEHRAPWIEPDPMPVRATDGDRLVETVRRLGVGDALIFGSSHQSPLPLALLLRWAGVERIAAVSHEHAGSLLDVRIKGDPDVHEVERNLLVAEALGYPRPADDRLRVDLGPPPDLPTVPPLSPPAAPDSPPVPPPVPPPGPPPSPDPSPPAAPAGPLPPPAGGPTNAGPPGDPGVPAALRAPGGRRPILGRFPAGEYVVVHPGATVPARTLSPERWRAVVDRLAAAGWLVLVTGSRQERGLTAAVAGHHRGVVDLGGRTTFRALGRLLEGAAALVAGNTGPVHLAAAVGAPVAAVFPPTVPVERWRPWRVPHVILGDQGVPCADCRSRVCPQPEQVCLRDVGPADVERAVAHLAAGPGLASRAQREPEGSGSPQLHDVPDERPVVSR